MKEKIHTYIALSRDDISGYLMDIDQRIIHIRGIADCTAPLLEAADSHSLLFNIEPTHLGGVRKSYKHFKPSDAVSKGKVTTFLSMIIDANEFKPKKANNVRELGREDAKEVGNLLLREPDRIKDLLKGLSYGLYEQGRLVAFAAAPEILDDLAIIRGVYTLLSLRGKGYATSVCSAVAARLLELGKTVFLYVSKENHPALNVYRKLGFKETGHVFLSFSAERK
jgi:RimJ/RimL family protein N-acetyltransferase